MDSAKYFCIKCNNFSSTDRCLFCNAKKLRMAVDNDPVYLTTQTVVYAGMLQEALLRNDIPCIKKEKHGGILKLVGIMSFEEFDFFVPIGSYKKAKEVLTGLFTSIKFKLAKNTKRFKQGMKQKNTKN